MLPPNTDTVDTKQRPARMLVEPNPVQPLRSLVRAKEVARKIRSFDHFAYVWGTKGKYFLPPQSCLSWHYISQVLAQEKKFLKIDEVGHALKLPKVRGFVIGELWERYKDVNDLKDYFPDIGQSQNVPRDYFLNARS